MSNPDSSSDRIEEVASRAGIEAEAFFFVRDVLHVLTQHVMTREDESKNVSALLLSHKVMIGAI